jgi:RNA polymerase sigma-70 factor (ECF subfamily)
MTIRDMTFTDAERLAARAGELDAVFDMDEDAFRAFYDRTARPLWMYLWRITGDRHAADDLLQETYYRLLRTRAPHEGDAHRRNALFHIATNLARDARRRHAVRVAAAPGAPVDASTIADPVNAHAGAEARTDLTRAMARLTPRERALVWLAYAQGSSHREIAEVVGVQTASVKLMLFRARRKLAAWLTRPGRPGGEVS